MTEAGDVYTPEYLAQQAAQQEDREAKKADLERAITDAEEVLQRARWDLALFESEEAG